MINRLPRWVEFSSFGLAANAGAVNAIGLIGFKQQTVSNLTGTSTRAGVALVNADCAEITYLFLVIILFMLGAALSGAVIDNAVLRLGRRYSLVLVIEAILLLLAMVLMRQGAVVGYLLAAAACGLQNGMVSTYSGAIVRTSHVTGLVTDLGILLGAKLRGHRVGARRVVLYLLILAGFIAGGLIGAYSFRYLQLAALIVPAGVALCYAAMCWVYRDIGNQRAEQA